MRTIGNRSFQTSSFRLRPLAAAASGLVLVGAALLSGCDRAESQPLPPPPPSVTVATAERGDVTDWSEFTGRFEAVDRVELRARVSGYIESVGFNEGGEVHKGDVLFVIDPRPYKAELEHAEGELARIKAQASYDASESQRAARLLQSRAISQEEHDQRVSRQRQSEADLRSAQAAVDAARLNLEFTRVVSPIEGRVSRANVTAGNYVAKGSDVLTSVVSFDPIYVSFAGDEQSYLRFRSEVHQNQQADGSDGSDASRVYVGLADETGYPHQGRIDFVDNALDPATGTIRIRARLDNADRRFTPGLLARVRLPGSAEYATTLIPEVAIGTDQDRRYVLVVAQDGTVEYRAVQLGDIHDDRRAIQDGLVPGERVIVSGLQHARPGTKVTPQPEQVATPANVVSNPHDAT